MHNYERPSLRFCRIDVDSAEEIADFILWLCYRSWSVESSRSHRTFDLDSTDARLVFEERSDPQKQVEDYWFFDAPRHRMAKLLWQQLQRSRSDEHFDQRFWFDRTALVKDSFDCGSILEPIQTRLRKVIQGCSDRREDDKDIQQGAWGEAFWLPREHSDYVRRQIRRARLDVIERAADYPHAMRLSLDYLLLHQVRAIQVPSTADKRMYRGYTSSEPKSRRVYNVVEIEAEGKRYPLINAREPSSSPGYNFTWGYGGGGPYALALSILADATNGDIDVSNELGAKFMDDNLIPLPMDDDISIARSEVLDWLQRHGRLKRKYNSDTWRFSIAWRNLRLKSRS